MPSKIPFPVPPDNRVESLRLAFQQLAQSTEQHVSGAVQVVQQSAAFGGGGAAGVAISKSLNANLLGSPTGAIGNTVNTKIPIVIAGVTYYLLASTSPA